MKAKYIGPNGIFDAGEECYRTLLSLPERLAIAAGIEKVGQPRMVVRGLSKEYYDDDALRALYAEWLTSLKTRSS